nr:helix-turn-helix domain-containing protein [Rhizobium leguminosarum]
MPLRAKGRKPRRQPIDTKKVEAAVKLANAGTSPSETAIPLGLGRSTVYRECTG